MNPRLSSDNLKHSIFILTLAGVTLYSYRMYQYMHHEISILSKELALIRKKEHNKYAMLRTRKESKVIHSHKWDPEKLLEKDVDQVNEKEQKIIEAFLVHQSNCKVPTPVESTRNLLESNCGFGVLSTIGIIKDKSNGNYYPSSAVVAYAMDYDGLPLFCFSKLSGHRHQLDRNSSASFTVLIDKYKYADDSRVVLCGNISKLLDNTDKDNEIEVTRLKEIFLDRHMGAEWIEFEDFSWYKFTNVKSIWYIGGFASAHTIQPEDFVSCNPDPHIKYSSHVMNHMNDDHSNELNYMIKHQTGLDVSDAMMVSLDRYGTYIRARVMIGSGGYTKVRLQWPQIVNTRLALKSIIMQMAKDSKLALTNKYEQ